MRMCIYVAFFSFGLVRVKTEHCSGVQLSNQEKLTWLIKKLLIFLEEKTLILGKILLSNTKEEIQLDTLDLTLSLLMTSKIEKM